jgi:hypothetical protein
MNIFASLLESKGVKRTIGSALALATVASPYIPVIAPYASLLQQAALYTGAAGAAHPIVLKVIDLFKRIIGSK